jgi:hypothetical protein
MQQQIVSNQLVPPGPFAAAPVAIAAPPPAVPVAIAAQQRGSQSRSIPAPPNRDIRRELSDQAKRRIYAKWTKGAPSL